MAANDHSRIGSVGGHDTSHDYKKIMEEAQDVKNWFQRAQGLWHDDPCYSCRRSGWIDTGDATDTEEGK